MNRGRWRYFSIVAWLFAIALTAQAAELIETPKGILVRSLLDWENAAGLEVTVAGKTLPVKATGGVADYLFSPDQVCEGAAYRLHPLASFEEDDSAPWHHLDAYCSSRQPKSMAFLLIADSQQYHEEHRKTGRLVAQLKQANPDVRFLVNGGDLVHFGAESEWRKYRAISTEEYSADLPLVPVVGNHEFYWDSKLTNWIRLYSTPETAKHYYTLDYPLFALVVLDSNIEWMSPSAVKTEDQWLEEKLSKYQGVKPVLVVFHHAGYTSGTTETIIPAPPAHIRTTWHPLFVKYKAKLILNGHEHLYERSLVDGVEYLVTGPAGGVFGEPGRENRYSQICLPDFRSVSLITVDNSGKVRIQSYSVEKAGALVDDYTF